MCVILVQCHQLKSRTQDSFFLLEPVCVHVSVLLWSLTFVPVLWATEVVYHHQCNFRFGSL